jgi:localization factor PodJL
MGEAETSGDSDRPTAEIEEASPKWLPRTLLHLREAAELGDAQAQFTLAVAYEKGLLVNEDLAWAARWYGQAAYQGHSEAQYIYGNFKLAGIGTKQDLGHAYRWMTIAARQGHQKASEASAQLEVRLGISALYLEREWANAFKPATGVSLFDPPTVEYVQTKLAKLGYAPGPADGFMGPRTAAALEKFKKDYGLAIEERLSKELLRMIHRESSEEEAQVGSPAL